MDSTYIFLQHYWWFLVSLLGALLVFLLFVQGGNSLLYAWDAPKKNVRCWSIPPGVNGNLPLPPWSLSEEPSLLLSLCFIAPALEELTGCG